MQPILGQCMYQKVVFQQKSRALYGGALLKKPKTLFYISLTVKDIVIFLTDSSSRLSWKKISKIANEKKSTLLKIRKKTFFFYSRNH